MTTKTIYTILSRSEDSEFVGDLFPLGYTNKAQAKKAAEKECKEQFLMLTDGDKYVKQPWEILGPGCDSFTVELFDDVIAEFRVIPVKVEL